MERPTELYCQRCGDDFEVKLRGKIPRYCPGCRRPLTAKERAFGAMLEGWVVGAIMTTMLRHPERTKAVVEEVSEGHRTVLAALLGEDDG